MKNILAYCLYGLIGIFTLLPLEILYALSPLIAWFLRKVLGYRKGIIRNNLKRSFPGKSGKDLYHIEKSYYSWLGRIVIESFKSMHWSLKTLQKRVRVINPELLIEYSKSGKDIIVLSGHTGNWEWSPAAIGPYGYDVLGVYKTQNSKTFDFLTKLIRSKKGVTPIPMKSTIRAIKENKKPGQLPKALLLISDQIPALGDIHLWTDFLNQTTAWFTGGEKLAIRFGLPVLYLKFYETRSGYYTAEFIPLFEGNEAIEKMEITKFYIRALEETIKEYPSQWLWSHRRWKHQPENISL